MPFAVKAPRNAAAIARTTPSAARTERWLSVSAVGSGMVAA
jgi:hypothetical protein